jgi:hypothetical protein
MAETGELATVETPTGENVFVPSGGGISIDLTAESSASEYEDSGSISTTDAQAYYKALANLYPTTPKTSENPQVNIKGKVVCFDTETTGTSPLTSKLVVCTFWDLSKGPETMETFSGWDEEILIKEIAEYLNREAPETLVAYNMGFDLNFLLTRMMAFGVRCPSMNKMKNFDVMTILGQGGNQFAKQISKVGTAEDWLQYFYGEAKPFTIDELLEGYKKNDLVPAIVRNHACVYCEGRMYQLMMQVWGGDSSFTDELVAPKTVTTKSTTFAATKVQCPVCLTNNNCKGQGAKTICTVCRTDLTSECTKLQTKSK